MKKILYFIFAIVFLMACANLGSPDGGPYDEDPPKVVSTTPKYASINTKVKKVTLVFNENVKIENAQENVIISPPQLEQPNIEALGKKITVSFVDSMKENTTYTIDFADAIQDNNEGNPLGDYAFTFSTGEHIDTFQVSGNVLDASNLEPIKGIMVGLYRIPDEESVAADSLSDSTVTIGVLPDSVFKTKPFERVSRTDSKGHFVIKGLDKDARYRVFALDDKNQNYMYDQKAELIAFNRTQFQSSCKPDVRFDTVWHDTIYYDSIKKVPYTHFYPDDIVLLAFESGDKDRFLIKYERPILQKFSFYFSSRSDTLPIIRGFNFCADSAFIVEASEHNDTLTYWLKDSLVYNIDTLNFAIDYYKTDTTGLLTLASDTIFLEAKQNKAKLEKEHKKAWDEWVKEYKKKLKEEQKAKKHAKNDKEATKSDDESKSAQDSTSVDSIPLDSIPIDSIPLDSLSLDSIPISVQDSVSSVVSDVGEEAETDEVSDDSDKKSKKGKSKGKSKKDEIDEKDIPPMPEEFMEIKFTGQALDPDRNVELTFPEPLDSVDMSKIHFVTKKDSTEIDEKFILKPVEGKIMQYRLYAEWVPDSTYFFKADTGAFVSIYGKRSPAMKNQVKVGSLDSYSTLFVVLHNADPSAVVQLMDQGDKVIKTVKSVDGKADFYFIKPGTYYMRTFYDRNGNGEWDTGDYDKNLMPEEVYYYDRPMELKAKWELTQDFTPTSVPIAKQKPEKITKQKADKEKKSSRSRNKERLEQKMNKNKKNNNSSNTNAAGGFGSVGKMF